MPARWWGTTSAENVARGAKPRDAARGVHSLGARGYEVASFSQEESMNRTHQFIPGASLAVSLGLLLALAGGGQSAQEQSVDAQLRRLKDGIYGVRQSAQQHTAETVYVADLGPVSLLNRPVEVDAYKELLVSARIDGVEYPNSLAWPKSTNYSTYSSSSYEELDLVYSISKEYDSFQAVVGVDDRAANARASVVFRVEGNGKALFTSKPMRANDAPVSINVPVAGVVRLRLVWARAETRGGQGWRTGRSHLGGPAAHQGHE